MHKPFYRATLALLFGIFVSTLAFAQSSSSRSVSVLWSGDDPNGFDLLTSKPHEVKLSLLSSTLLLHPEVAYEYTFNLDLSAGARVGFSINAEGVPNAMLGMFQLSPYARWHFYKETKGNALRGFFVELNTAYTYYDGLSYNNNFAYNKGMGHQIAESEKERRGSAFGFGVGSGYKWITKRAWTFELGGSIGRNLVHPEPAVYYGMYHFVIGKRF